MSQGRRPSADRRWRRGEVVAGASRVEYFWRFLKGRAPRSIRTKDGVRLGRYTWDGIWRFSQRYGLSPREGLRIALATDTSSTDCAGAVSGARQFNPDWSAGADLAVCELWNMAESRGTRAQLWRAETAAAPLTEEPLASSATPAPGSHAVTAPNDSACAVVQARTATATSAPESHAVAAPSALLPYALEPRTARATSALESHVVRAPDAPLFCFLEPRTARAMSAPDSRAVAVPSAS